MRKAVNVLGWVLFWGGAAAVIAGGANAMMASDGMQPASQLTAGLVFGGFISSIVGRMMAIFSK